MAMLSRISKSRLIGASIVLAVILFVAVNIIAANAFRSARVDLTEGGLYSLSGGTRTLLDKLDEPIHMRFFLSHQLMQAAPQLVAYANRVRAMLDTYASLSHGRITLEVIDPPPFSDAEDRAVGLGINRFRLAGAPDPLFFGLAATNSTNGRAQIPVFAPDREAFLEYDLTRLVAELGQPAKPKVTILDGLGLSENRRTGTDEAQILTQLREIYAVEMVGGEIDSLPADTRVVLVVHPQGLSDRTLYTLDQWVLGGGATMVFVDPDAETQQGPRPGMPAPDPTSNLGKLFAAWGVGFDPSKAVADPVNALRIARTIDGRETEVANYPWIAVSADGMDKSDAVLARLSTIFLTTAGAFTTTRDDVTLKPLMTASAQAGFVPATEAANATGDPRRLLASLEKPAAPPVLAARLQGALKTAFPDGKPKDSTATATLRAKLEGAPNVVLVGDADMLMDRNWIQRGQLLGQPIAQAFANNGDFVMNVVEQMGGGAVLADLRGRGVSWRPFERIQALEQAAEARLLSKQQELTKRVHDIEGKLRAAAPPPGKEGELVSSDSARAVEQFRAELLASRAELRDVQYQLRRDVDSLKSWITVGTVGIIPALVGFIALGIALRRPKRPVPTRRKADDDKGGVS